MQNNGETAFTLTVYECSKLSAYYYC